MAFKKIVVPVTGAEGDAAALAGAFAAARPFDGFVEALFVSPDPREAVPYIGMPVSPEVVQAIIDSAEEVTAAAKKRAHANFEAAARNADVTVVPRPVAGTGVRASFATVSGHFSTRVRQAVCLSDLVVFGPATSTEGGPDIGGAFIDTLTKSKRPVLLAPERPVTDLTVKIVVGWDGGAAAAHALSAALPFLQKAAAVDIYSIRDVPENSHVLDEPITYLKLHGVTAGTRVIDPGDTAPGAVLLSEAEQAGATMLVLGGYGHSRTLETLFGGATVHITAHATLPLFMVH
jgi:nucleotide-binding universal stress UspA family protein